MTTATKPHNLIAPACRQILAHEGFPLCWSDPMQRWARGERPDDFGVATHPHDSGWRNHWNGDLIPIFAGDSMVLERKVSRADRRADDDKQWRQKNRQALGNFRAFVCPAGLIEDYEVPEDCRWGLYWLYENGSFECKRHPQRFDSIDWWATVALVARLAGVDAAANMPRATPVYHNVTTGRPSEAPPAEAQSLHQSSSSRKGASMSGGKLNAMQRQQVVAIVKALKGNLRGLDVARDPDFDCQGKRPGTVADWIVQDVERGLVPGVKLDRADRTLWPEGGGR